MHWSCFPAHKDYFILIFELSNMNNIIQAHNRRIRNKDTIDNADPGCDCRNKSTCQTPGKCRTKYVFGQPLHLTETNIYTGYLQAYL